MDSGRLPFGSRSANQRHSKPFARASSLLHATAARIYELVVRETATCSLFSGRKARLRDAQWSRCRGWRTRPGRRGCSWRPHSCCRMRPGASYPLTHSETMPETESEKHRGQESRRLCFLKLSPRAPLANGTDARGACEPCLSRCKGPAANSQKQVAPGSTSAEPGQKPLQPARQPGQLQPVR